MQSGVRTRQVNSSFPEGCVGGTSIVSETCEYVSPVISPVSGGGSGGGGGGSSGSSGGSSNGGSSGETIPVLNLSTGMNKTDQIYLNGTAYEAKSIWRVSNIWLWVGLLGVIFIILVVAYFFMKKKVKLRNNDSLK